MMERRDFIQACAVILGSSVLPIGCGQSGAGNGVSDGSSSLPDLSRARWTSIPDTTFSVSHASYGAIDMSMTAIDNEMYDPATDQFSVVLTGPDTPLFEEGAYRMYNSALGYIELYLQPGESGPGRQSYRTLFSLLQT